MVDKRQANLFRSPSNPISSTVCFLFSLCIDPEFAFSVVCLSFVVILRRMRKGTANVNKLLGMSAVVCPFTLFSLVQFMQVY